VSIAALLVVAGAGGGLLLNELTDLGEIAVRTEITNVSGLVDNCCAEFHNVLVTSLLLRCCWMCAVWQGVQCVLRWGVLPLRWGAGPMALMLRLKLVEMMMMKI
jgi:hypothetical protein